MRGMRRTAWFLAAVALSSAGCKGGGGSRKVVTNEPGLEGPIEPGGSTVAASPDAGTSVTWADRHPLFSKPRQYYENTSNSNKAVKVAKAAVIGVPAGLFGELKQIVAGNASESRAMEVR